MPQDTRQSATPSMNRIRHGCSCYPISIFWCAIVLFCGLLTTLVPTAAIAQETPQKILRVVSDDNYPPFLFIDPQGRAIGYVADWWALWSQKTGVKVDLQALEWAESQRRLLNGEADAIDLIFRTPPREPLYDFTASYADVPVALYTHASIAGIQDSLGLRGFQIGVMAGDACIDMLRLQGITDLRQYKSYTALIDGALANEIKLFCLDEYPANYYLYREKAQKGFRKAFNLYEGHFHRAVKEGDTATLQLIERGSSAISAAEDAALRAKWMPLEAIDYGPYLRYASLGLAVLASIALVLFFWLRTMRAAVKRQTAALRESEERFRRLFDDTRQAITLLEDGKFIAANQASLAMLGMERLDQFIGRTPNDFSPERQPDGQLSAEKAPALISVAFQQGSNQFEWEHIRADGEHILVEVLLTAIRQGDKELLHVVWSDITAKRKTEQELENYRQQLEQRVAERTHELAAMTESLRGANAEQQAILDAASAGIMLIRDRVIERCNRRLEEMSGYAAGELTGQPTQLLYADESAWIAAGTELYRQISCGQTYAQEQLARAKDGSTFWVRLAARAIDPADLGKGIVGQMEDITAAHAAADAVRLANEEQQAIFDTATSGMALIKDRVLIRCNRRLHEIFGWSPGSMVGQTTAIWYRDEAANAAGGNEVYEHIWRGESHRREQELMRKDGSLFWARLTGNAVDVDDRAKGTVWMIDDITGERAAIEEMRKARALAEEAVRMKSDFLANMSHEIRTPMNAIIGMSHLVLKTDMSQRQRGYLTKIQSSSQHLLGIINDILDFSKIEAGKMIIERVDFKLERVLDNVAGLIAEKAAAKKLELIIDVAEDVPTHLVGDPLRMGQVLVNYANNAVKFTEHGEIVIRIAVARASERDVFLRISVRDTGIGLSEEQRGRLFKSFEQADTSTTRKFGGTGLGLAISKHLAELMGGEVGVDSAPGVGSTFWFTARFGRGEDKALRMQPNSDLRGRRMLLVDDNDSAREVIGDMLRSMSFVVAAVPSGSKAVAEIARADAAGEAYDVVFLDWQMPIMDGIATAWEIHRLQLEHPPGLVMITAYGRDELLKPAQEAGIEQVLIKPVNASLLFDAVIGVLGLVARDRAALSAGETGTTDLSTIRGAQILLVEDNELNQEVATELLQQAGFVVDLANDGQVALERVQTKAYDAVLMDMQMPVMDGMEATRQIRLLPGLAELPILAMTANAMTGDRERCIDIGMNDHIAKPIDPEVLWSKLLQWVKPLRAPEKVGAGGTAPGVAVPDSHHYQSAQITALAAISGLDPMIGLRLALGREELYFSLLAKFISSQHDFATRMTAALASADSRTAIRLAHTLKGAAAQIGATELPQIAEQLELAIGQREPTESEAPLQNQIDNLARYLSDLVEAIKPHLPATLASPAPLQIDQTQLRDVCSQLARQLADDDFGCGRHFENNEALLRAALGKHYAWIAEAISSFNFAAALDWLKEACAENGLEL